MVPNHRQRRAFGREGYALAACAVVVTIGLAAGAAASGALGGTPAAALTKTLLTSVGTDGAAATADNARAAISENGRYVAFQSQATLNVSSFPPPPPTTAPPTTSNPDPAPTSPPTTGPPTAVPPTTAPPTTPPPTTAPPTSPPPVFAPANSPKPSSPAPDVVPAQAAAAAAGNWRIYARDQTGLVTSLLSDVTGNATAPTISETGKLVSYLFNDGFENSIVVANRQATGTGAFDTKQNLVIKTVTGTPNDLQFERIVPDCPSGIGKGGLAMRTTPCGPKLSADGRTLVYPAQLSPISPAIFATDTDFGLQDPFQITGNFVDFGENGPTVGSGHQITFTNQGPQPVTLSGVTLTGPFTTRAPLEGPTCVGTLTLQPHGFCSVIVDFANQITSTNPDGCPSSGLTIRTGTLQTDGAVPDGQSQLTLVAFCDSSFRGTAGVFSGRRAAIQLAGGCPAPPTGLTQVTAPNPQPSQFETPVTDFGPTVIGQPYESTITFTIQTFSETPNDVEFLAPDCGLQLLNPTTSGGDLVPCVPATITGLLTCTAEVLVIPGSVGTDVATMIQNPDVSSEAQIVQYASVTGLSNVIIARHDTSGDGNFGASPSTKVNVDGTGTVIEDASQPSVSQTGRYVAFTAPATDQVVGSTSVWRHDADSANNQTFHSGATIEVSCLPGIGACNAAPDADSPSISGDGSQVAFATIALLQGEVYDRDVTAGATALVSAPATGNGNANGFSYAPSMSEDGSTVAYISTATNLEVPATPAGAANLYIRNLLLGAGAVSELATPSGTSLPPKDDIALPDVDALGGLVTFQTSQQLLPAAPPLVTSIYTFEREPALTFNPAPVSFGTLKVGSAGATVTVTVTNTGPGPGTVTTADTTEPFGLTFGACTGQVLHDGESCVVTVSLTPQQAGTDNGTLTTTVTDELGSPGIFSVPITATIVIVKVPENAKIAVNPFVAPAGQVTDVTGHGFIAGQHVTLSWDHGLGQVSVVANGAGQITAVMVIFPDDYTGLRTLEARDLTNKVLATAAFLAQQPTIGPPFNSAGVPGLPSPPKLPATPA